MKNTLHQYVAQHNSWEKIFNKSHVDIDINNITQAQAHSLILKLDSEMSPENLHCDGEITHSQAQAKYDYFMGVWEDIKDLYAQNGWTLPMVYELA